MLNGWLIVVDRLDDLPQGVADLNATTTRDYLVSRPAKTRFTPKILNLSRDYAYQTRGYYCSLLAEARGQKVVPSVTTILDLARRSHYAYALPDLEDTLNRTLRRLAEPPVVSFRLHIHLGVVDDPRFERFAAQLFDWFRHPVIEVSIQAGDWWCIRRIRRLAITDLHEDQKEAFGQALRHYIHRRWRSPKTRAEPRFSLAVLCDPKEALPPSDAQTFRHFTRIAEPMGLGVETITRRDLPRLAEHDALWIRETTNIDHHTYRFALRAEQEGMPVIDDPASIRQCTNKVYLAEVLGAHGIGTPQTRVIASLRDIPRIENDIGYPVVLKIPDGSFSRGVKKAENREELTALTRAMLEESDLILAQEFMYTEFDWRVGVLDGEALFVSQYRMAKKHWQIVRHREGRRAIEGGFRTLAIDDAPAEVVSAGVRAARLIGRGLHGVDVKQNDRGVFVIEVNDNPNLVHTVEDSAEGDRLWQRLATWFLDRLR
ncbi:MAG: RimK family protein [Geminicoccaceae bacterium]|nr:RimK family protein [Geminicoccaceae bacterium]